MGEAATGPSSSCLADFAAWTKRKEDPMEYRRLGRSGLFVSTMTLGTMTFGGRGGFEVVGSTDVATATR